MKCWFARKPCRRCKKKVRQADAFCRHCGLRLRDTREVHPACPPRDVAFIRDLYNFAWYNRQVTALVLYEQLAAVTDLYGKGRAEESIPPVEELRTQKILRAKIFMEFIGILEAFGMLCLALRHRATQSIIWSFTNIEPQAVSSFFDSILNTPGVPSLQRVLRLPSRSQFERAAARAPTGPLRGMRLPPEPYEKLAANLKLVAEHYRDKSAVNVATYNRLKHGFIVVEGDGWFTPSLNPDHAHVMVDTTQIRSDRVGIHALKLEQEGLDQELANIRAVTLMGAELLAMTLALRDLNLLYPEGTVASNPSYLDSSVKR